VQQHRDAASGRCPACPALPGVKLTIAPAIGSGNRVHHEFIIVNFRIAGVLAKCARATPTAGAAADVWDTAAAIADTPATLQDVLDDVANAVAEALAEVQPDAVTDAVPDEVEGPGTAAVGDTADVPDVASPTWQSAKNWRQQGCTRGLCRRLLDLRRRHVQPPLRRSASNTATILPKRTTEQWPACPLAMSPPLRHVPLRLVSFSR
jgi:hypothetical protein